VNTLRCSRAKDHEAHRSLSHRTGLGCDAILTPYPIPSGLPMPADHLPMGALLEGGYSDAPHIPLAKTWANLRALSVL